MQKICLVHGNEILNLGKKERIIDSLSKSDKIILILFLLKNYF